MACSPSLSTSQTDLCLKWRSVVITKPLPSTNNLQLGRINTIFSMFGDKIIAQAKQQIINVVMSRDLHH